jgi:ATP-dependent DNA helicase RecG
MNIESIRQIFDNLLHCPENEVIEFKKAEKNYDFRKIGKYFSALSNEANLKEKDAAWLVFGVVDKSREIVGSAYRVERKDLDSLKKEIADKITANITFVEIHELDVDGQRVVMFEIPAAPKGLPLAYDGHYYGRDGESLSALNLEEIERIRSQATDEDWSVGIVDDATLDDLDPNALAIAREKFKEKHSNNPRYEDIDNWDTTQFLDKAKISVNGKLTRTTLLLLGNSAAVHKLSPHPSQITWKLDSEEKSYEHFSPPFLLATTEVLQNIRNIKQKLFPRNQLLATEVQKYDNRVILEALHNCIAHQDYTRNSRIIVTEKVDRLIFTNAGSFFEGSAEDYLTGERTPQRYRNPWLAQAMVQLGMIDTMGYGIHTMTVEQRNRFFPLPDYSKSDRTHVVLEIFGHSLNENYSLMLLENQDLNIDTVILLDRVQKHLPITDEAAAYLRKRKLIEGRKPNYFIAAHLAEKTENKADYIKNRGFDNAYYKSMILEYLKKYKKATREEITALILDKLPDVLDEQQKQNRIKNILYAMSKTDRSIEKMGTSRKGYWKIRQV